MRSRVWRHHQSVSVIYVLGVFRRIREAARPSGLLERRLSIGKGRFSGGAVSLAPDVAVGSEEWLDSVEVGGDRRDT